ncbi:MAG: hypothetical protein IT537_11100 [Hyphomicrobiales bacterium]|nr:hypothetical protein [Hyphomicrobiales bacterium]
MANLTASDVLVETLIKWDVDTIFGLPGDGINGIDFAAVARGFGVTAFSVDDPAKCGQVLKQALDVPGPALVEAVVDPHEPPMPPKATAKQLLHLAESIAKGTPAGGEIALTVASDVVREIV